MSIVIAPQYLLRDYMNDNAEIFIHDPKAIPSFAPDFARTPRNVVLELIMRMVISPVRSEEVRTQLELLFGEVGKHSGLPERTDSDCISFRMASMKI